MDAIQQDNARITSSSSSSSDFFVGAAMASGVAVFLTGYQTTIYWWVINVTRVLFIINMGKPGQKLSITTKAVISRSTKLIRLCCVYVNGDEILFEKSVLINYLLGIRTKRHVTRSRTNGGKLLGSEIMTLPKRNSRMTTTNMIIYGQHHYISLSSARITYALSPQVYQHHSRL